MTARGSDKVLEEKIDSLRSEQNERHKQNRDDYARLREDVADLRDDHQALHLRLIPVLGVEGKAGGFDEIVADVRSIREQNEKQTLEMERLRGEAAGRKAATKQGWIVVGRWLAVLTVICLALAAWFAYLEYKKADDQGWLKSQQSFTQYSQLR